MLVPPQRLQGPGEEGGLPDDDDAGAGTWAGVSSLTLLTPFSLMETSSSVTGAGEQVVGGGWSLSLSGEFYSVVSY